MDGMQARRADAVDDPPRMVFDRPMPPDQQVSPLEQVGPMIAAHPLSAWAAALEAPAKRATREAAPGERDVATLLLAVNYELLGYSPDHAWLLAQRGEPAAPGRLDG